MTDLPIALQLYTVRDALDRDLPAALDEVAAIGYRHVELADAHGRTPAEWAALLADRGLTPIARHEMWAWPDDRAQQAAADARAVGYGYAVQPWWPVDLRTPDGYGRVAETAARAEARGDAAGVRFAYHNHDFEFDGGAEAFLSMFEGPALVAELDTCWVAVAGQDVPDVMGRLSGKVPLLHIKDCSDYAAKTLCEIGAGRVPIRDILQAARPCGAEYLVVEQDNNWVGGDPLRSARVSYDRLREMAD